MSKTLNSAKTDSDHVPCVAEPVLLESNQNHATVQTDGVCTALPASMGMGGGYVPMVTEEVAYPTCNQGGTAVCELVVYNGEKVTSPYNKQTPTPGVCHTLDRDSRNYLVSEETVGTLCGSGYPDKLTNQDVVSGLYPVLQDQTLFQTMVMQAFGDYKPGEVGSSCKMRDHKDATDLVVLKKVRWIVRRLTPMECERLQGYPDHWTDIGEWTDSKGKKHKDADSPRYKALGNSIALPYWLWMFRRMARFLPENATLGSLFAGIGGFDLTWEMVHGKGTSRWSSEIEEFPIAVLKKRFGDEETGTEGDA